MGFLSRLIGTKTTLAEASIAGSGEFPIEVVGESNYQHAIETAAGGRTENSCEKIVDAILVLGNANKWDPKAVKVEIGGRTCGYLSRGDARDYRRELKAAGHPQINAACKAMIVGGWDRGADDRGHFGLRLDHPSKS